MLLALAKRFGLNRSGAAGVEFGIVLPLLVILAFGGIEMGRMVWQHSIITKGVRNGVRYLTRVPVTCGDAAGPGSITSQDDADAAINLVKTGTVSTGTSILAAYDNASADFEVEVDCVAATNGLIGGPLLPLVRMTVQVPYEDFFIGLIGLDETTFSVTHEELNVGE